LRVLIAEDHAVNQKVALGMLNRLGFAADVAANGPEVLDAVTRRTYDLILMDVQMPEIDGLETSRILRSWLPQELQPRIVAVTAHAAEEDRDRCLEAGMDAYIEKPVRIAQLSTALRQTSRLAVPDVPPRLPPRPATVGNGPDGARAHGPDVTASKEAVASGFDPSLLEELLELLGPEGTEQLVDLYLSGSPQEIGNLGLACANRDAVAVEGAAHRIRGASANLGGSEVARIALALEQMGAAGDLSDAGATLIALEDAQGHLEAALRRRLAEQRDEIWPLSGNPPPGDA
jgi:CheY-like chemotaxis protein/HPt (histidine-containing phosphotransfer) domain-containing protein